MFPITTVQFEVLSEVLYYGDIFSADDPNARQVGTTEMGDAISAAV